MKGAHIAGVDRGSRAARKRGCRSPLAGSLRGTQLGCDARVAAQKPCAECPREIIGRSHVAVIPAFMSRTRRVPVLLLEPPLNRNRQYLNADRAPPTIRLVIRTH